MVRATLNRRAAKRRRAPVMLGPLRWTVPALDRIFACFSKVSTAPYLDLADFPWVEEIERCWPAIRKEADLLYEVEPIPGFEDISPAERILTDDGRWKTYFFTAYGNEVEANCRHCPETWQALRRISGLVSACFSILEPGKELPEHRGLNRGVLRYHLAVRIPRDGGGCALTVDGETRPWTEGKSLLFDDTYLHCAYNRSSGHRVVLFADVARPLRFPAGVLHRLLVRVVARSRYMRTCKQLLAQWEARTGAADRRTGGDWDRVA